MSRRLSHSVKLSADPAAGAEVAFTADHDMVVLSFDVELVTDATVANRQIVVTFEDADGNIYFRSPADDVQAASLTEQYVGIRGSDRKSVDGNVHVLALPDDGVFLPEDGVVRTETVAGVAGDNLSKMRLLVARA